jgi:hypothetical protein
MYGGRLVEMVAKSERQKDKPLCRTRREKTLRSGDTRRMSRFGDLDSPKLSEWLGDGWRVGGRVLLA